MASLDTIYNYRETVHYLTQPLPTVGNDDEHTKTYRSQLEKVFMLGDAVHNTDGEYETNYVDISTKKIDELYNYLTTYHGVFLKNLLYHILTINNNYSKLSNNLYFYLCCCNFSRLSVDITRNFDIMEHYTNKNVEMFIFSFLFSFNCFEYLHRILQKYANYNGEMTKAVFETVFKSDADLMALSNAFAQTFRHCD